MTRNILSIKSKSFNRTAAVHSAIDLEFDEYELEYDMDDATEL